MRTPDRFTLRRHEFHTLYDVQRELARCYHDIREGAIETHKGNVLIKALKEIGIIIEQQRVEARMSALDAKIAVLREMLAGTPLEQLPEWARLPVIEHGAILVRDENDVLDEPR